MKPKIIKYDSNAEFDTEERCFINELSNSADDPEVSIAQARVEPGMTTEWHSLIDTVERYVIISGTGDVAVDNEPVQELTVGDVVIIPPNCRQRITNTGDQQLLFLAICSPPFRVENYVQGGDKD